MARYISGPLVWSESIIAGYTPVKLYHIEELQTTLNKISSEISAHKADGSYVAHSAVTTTTPGFFTPTYRKKIKELEDLIDDITVKARKRLPSGIIIMYNGSVVSNPPPAWYFCNGSGSTPDTRNRVILGSRNGSNIYPVGSIGSITLKEPMKVSNDSSADSVLVRVVQPIAGSLVATYNGNNYTSDFNVPFGASVTFKYNPAGEYDLEKTNITTTSNFKEVYNYLKLPHIIHYNSPILTYKVKITQPTTAKIIVNGIVTTEYKGIEGETVTIAVKNTPAYVIDSVKINGSATQLPLSFVLTNDLSIEATEYLRTYDVKVYRTESLSQTGTRIFSWEGIPDTKSLILDNAIYLDDPNKIVKAKVTPITTKFWK